MLKSTGTYPSLTVDTTAKRVVSHAGAMLLAATAGRVGPGISSTSMARYQDVTDPIRRQVAGQIGGLLWTGEGTGEGTSSGAN